MRTLTGIQKVSIAIVFILLASAVYYFSQTQAGVSVGLVSVEPGFVCGTSTVNDADGNTYNTVQIGQQCWMKQNMRVGTRINIAGNQTNNGVIEKYCYSDDLGNCMTNNNPNYPDGGLYQWDEAMQYSTTEGAQGICPAGWHIPTHDEFTMLERSVATSSTYVTDFPFNITTTGYRGTYEGTILTPNATSGFEGNLTGRSSGGSFVFRGSYFYLLSSSESGGNAWGRYRFTTNTQVGRGIFPKTDGMPIRCLKDAPTTAMAQTLDTNPNLERGLVGHWTFDGPDFTDKVYDTSGQWNHGYLYNLATSSAKSIGVIGQGVKFVYGINNQYIRVASSSSINDLTQKTITFWLRKTFRPLLDNGHVMEKGSSGWDLRISNTNVIQFIHNFTGGSGSWQTVDYIPNGWVMYAITYDKSSASNDPVIYQNGQAVAITENGTPAGTAVTDTAYNITMGDYPGAWETVDGELDDIRIYNRILSAEEIKRLYQLGATTKINQTLTNPTLDSGLVGHWTFDGLDFTDKVYDISGQGNHGYVVGGATSSVKTLGQIGQGMNFNSTYVDVGSGSSLDNIAQVSISAWVKARSSDGNESIIRKWAPVYGYNLFFLAGNLTLSQNFTGPTGYWYPSTPINMSEWTHVVITYDRSVASNDPLMYFNGVAVATAQIGSPSGTFQDDASGNLHIGTQWDGLIDDVRIYNRILSADEVKRLYDLGR